jgi:ketosteroid isomerase-like protein
MAKAKTVKVKAVPAKAPAAARKARAVTAAVAEAVVQAPVKAAKPPRAKAAKSTLPYSFYIDIVTKRYFDGVDNKNMEQILDCFTEDAVLTELTSGAVHKGRDAGIRKMFEGLFANFENIWHGNFVHVADPQTNAICSQFTVLIDPKGTGTTLRYENSNRFYLKDRLFHRVYVYMSGDNLLK